MTTAEKDFKRKTPKWREDRYTRHKYWHYRYVKVFDKNGKVIGFRDKKAHKSDRHKFVNKEKAIKSRDRIAHHNQTRGLYIAHKDVKSWKDARYWTKQIARGASIDDAPEWYRLNYNRR